MTQRLTLQCKALGLLRKKSGADLLHPQPLGHPQRMDRLAYVGILCGCIMGVKGFYFSDPPKTP